MANFTEAEVVTSVFEQTTFTDVTLTIPSDVINHVTGFCRSCVSQYLASRVSRALWTYMSPCLLALGTLGNLLTLLVLGSKHNKRTPIDVALAFLAAADLGVLYISLLHQWVRFVWKWDLRVLSNFTCKVHLTLTLFVMALSPNILALTTVERALSVLWPLKIGSWISKKRMLYACVLMTSFVLVCHVPLLVAAYLEPDVPEYRRCQWHDPDFTKVWYWVSFVLDFLGPLAVIVTGNALIIARLTIAAARRSKSTKTKGKPTSSTTRMLILVGVVYLVTMTPHNVYRVGTSYGAWPNRPEDAYARLQLVIAVGYQLMYVNSAVNFLLYCLAGSRFRETLRLMMTSRSDRGRGSMPGDDMRVGRTGNGTTSEGSASGAVFTIDDSETGIEAANVKIC